jgi:hypothetical protein
MIGDAELLGDDAELPERLAPSRPARPHIGWSIQSAIVQQTQTRDLLALVGTHAGQRLLWLDIWRGMVLANTCI